MTKTFLVEISHSRISPITVKATGKLEAIDRALRNEGQFGDNYDGDTVVVAVKCLQEE